MHSVCTARGLTILVSLVAVSLLLGSCCKVPEPVQEVPPVSVVIEPEEDWNPPKTQHTFIVTVFDAEGRPMPNVQVHWILARTGDAVGDIVTYDDQELGENAWWLREMTQKTDNHYAVSYTNEEREVLHAGNRWDSDPEVRMQDFEVLPGQTWCTITSPVEGDSHMIAFVPAIENAHCHKVFAVKHWVPMPELMITKECPEQKLMGETFTYNITVKNVGMASTQDIMLHEELPEGISITDGTSFPMSIGVLAPDQERTVSFQVRADTPGNKLNRTWAVAGPLNVSADCLTVILDYGIDLVKTCNGRYVIGENVPFTINVTNTRGATLSNVVVTDPLPNGVEFVSANGSAGSASLGADGRTITWQGFDLAGGATASLNIMTRATTPSTPTNSASVTATVAGTSMTVNDSDSCQVEIIGLPRLNISKTCEPTNLGLGDPVTFRITVWNTGGAPATNVMVADLCPSGLQPVGDTNWTIDNLPPSDMSGGRTFTLQATATQPGTFTNVATATASGSEEVRDSCNVTVRAPMLTIRKECQAQNPAVPEDISIMNRMERATHTITVTNGDVKADDVVVVDTIPLDSSGRERIRYLSSNPAGNYDAASHRVTWNLGSLAANQSVTLSVEFEGRSVGPAINTASVTARGFGGAQDDCRLYVLGSPAFQESVVDVLNGNPDADNFLVGQPFYYLAMVQNEGDADLKIDVVFTLSSELKLESTPVGFIPSLTSTVEPSGSNVLSVSDLGGSKYQISSFNLGPREVKWVKIPVSGTRATSVDAATIEVEINWQLWFEGRLFPRKGKLTDGETTVIDPE